jgi:outer membrane protein assembly factor BamA
MSGIAQLRAARLARWACILIIAFCGSNEYPQEQQPSSYEGLEGRPVSKVDISADPTMDAESFRALLALNAGESFSVQSMRNSVNALQKTRLFSQVQVSVEPQQNGSQVLFILQLTSYVGNCSPFLGMWELSGQSFATTDGQARANCSLSQRNFNYRCLF